MSVAALRFAVRALASAASGGAESLAFQRCSRPPEQWSSLVKSLFATSTNTRQQMRDTVDEPESQPLRFPDMDDLAKLNPELAEAILADEKLQRETSMSRVMEAIRKRYPDVHNTNSQALLSYMRDKDLDEELMKCGIALPENALRKAKLNMLGAFLELEQVDEDEETDEDLARIEEENANEENFPIPTGPKFKFADVVTPEDITSVLGTAHAQKVCIIDVVKESRFANHFVIATGRSKRHLFSLAAAVLHKLTEKMKEHSVEEVTKGLKPAVEGEMGDEWLLVDAGSVVVHLFLERARSYYDLESLWGKRDNIEWIEAETSVETLDTIKADNQN
ncbi:hypothetical protein BSKO_07517 [Bryopsis sp. KO-2023]|nr:hypothetical protein BSKO_07517 [Bryopsis sp. KO-2023]